MQAVFLSLQEHAAQIKESTIAIRAEWSQSMKVRSKKRYGPLLRFGVTRSIPATIKRPSMISMKPTPSMIGSVAVLGEALLSATPIAKCPTYIRGFLDQRRAANACLDCRGSREAGCGCRSCRHTGYGEH